jgi:hypothetical protein
VSVPPGIALHNPGDIERAGDTFHYQGEVVPSRDPVLREFISDTWGLRAILECLLAYILKDGITTLGGAIERWAPPTENDTVAYQAAVCAACNASNATDFSVAWLRANAQTMLVAITQREVSHVYDPNTTSAAIGLITWPQET